MEILEMLESKRILMQTQIDQTKSQKERNKLGQFATPHLLATEILIYAKQLFQNKKPIRFLDPAFGTGSFYSALLKTFPSTQIACADGFEIDPLYADKAIDLWKDTGLQLRIEDFTTALPPNENSHKANLLICNPPYVRHHHLTRLQKERLQRRIAPKYTLSELAGLYCYFLLLADDWLAPNGIGAWLVPGEFLDVNYGKTFKDYLLKNVTLLRIHSFAPHDTQFTDALVSSAIVFFTKSPPQENHVIEFTYGGSLMKPLITKRISANILTSSAKWSKVTTTIAPKNPEESEHIKLSALFAVKRGLATGANDYFIISQKEARIYDIPATLLTPILPSARYLRSNEIQADGEGNPLLDKGLFLINCNLPEDIVVKTYPGLWRYLQKGIEAGVNQKYLCSHRKPWYAQEQRRAPLFLCTYMGRKEKGEGNPFRFILNHSSATAANSYLLLYPQPKLESALTGNTELAHSLWHALNAISPANLIAEGRVYGGGLHKLEPKELANALIPHSDFLANLLEQTPRQMGLFNIPI